MLGPLFWKECLTLARQRRMFALRVAVAVLMLLALWVGFGRAASAAAAFRAARSLPGFWQRLPNGKNAWTRNPYFVEGASGSGTLDWKFKRQALEYTGTQLAGWWAIGGGVLVLLLVPMLLAGVVAGERAGGTLETLFTTHLSGREILAGKSAGRLLPLLAAFLASAPVLVLASTFGGFTAVEIAWASAVLAALTAAVAGLALFASVRSARPIPALFQTYTLLGLAIVAFYAAATFPQHLPRIVPAALAEVEPFAALRRSFAARDPSEEPPWLAVTVLSAFGGLLVAVAGSRLRTNIAAARPPLAWRLAAGSFHGTVSRLRRALERSRGAGLGSVWRLQLASERRVERKLGELADRAPLRYRHSVANIYDPQRWIALLLWLPAVVGIVSVGVLPRLARYDVGGFLESLRWTVGAATWALPFSALLLAAGAWARERQALSWDLLRLANLPARQHVAAAFLGVFRTLRPGFFLLAGGIFLAMTSGGSDLGAFCSLLALVAQLAMLTAGGLAASAASDRVGPALTRALAAWGLAFAVAALPMPSPAELGGVSPLALGGVALIGVAAASALLVRSSNRRLSWIGPPVAFAASTLFANMLWTSEPRAAPWVAPRLNVDFAGPLSLRNFLQPYWTVEPAHALTAALIAAFVAAATLRALARNFHRFAAANSPRRGRA